MPKGGKSLFAIWGLDETSDTGVAGDDLTNMTAGFVLTGEIDPTADYESIWIVINGVEFEVTDINPDGTWTFTYPEDAPPLEGTVTVDAFYRITHPKSGKTQDTYAQSYSFEIDADPPAAPSGVTVSDGVISGSAEVGAKVLVYATTDDGRHLVGSATVDGNGNWSYDLADATGTFELFTEDTAGNLSQTSSTVEVGTNTNTAPTAIDDAVATDEDTPLTVDVLGNDADGDGDTLTVQSVTQGANGTVTLTDGLIAYTPDENFSGTDSFTYTISDGNGGTDTATVNVTVNPVNDAPVATDDTASVSEDTAVQVAILANDSDVDGDQLTVAGAGGAANGSVAINDDGTITYTPDADFAGTDSFSYTISDGNGGTESATVTVTVAPVNDAPVATDDSPSTNEDTAVQLALLGNDTDVDGDTLTVQSATQGANGTVALVDGVITYTPNADFNGSDSFTYTISDGNGGTDTATVTVTVDPVDDAPVAADDATSTDEDTAVRFAVLANDSDVDGDGLSIQSVTQGANGSVVVNADGTVTYTPNAGFTGTDSFDYVVSDGSLTDTGTVAVTVTAANDAPMAVGDSATTGEDTAVTIAVLGNDSDPDDDALTIAGTGAPGNGSVAVNPDGTITYTPDTDFNGSDSFTYTVSDGNGGTDTATVSVTVNAMNDAPVAAIDAFGMAEDTQLKGDVLVNDSDVDGDALTVALDTAVTNGTLTLNADGTFVYTPNANFNGSDSFSYTVSDGNGGTDTATVSITVDAVNDTATIGGVADGTVVEDGTGQIAQGTLAVDDPDAGEDTLQAIAAGTAGTGGYGTFEVQANGTWTYTLDNAHAEVQALGAAESLTDSITVQSADGTASATVSVTIDGANDVPLTTQDSVSTERNTAVVIAVLANDSDPDGDGLALAEVTDGLHGTVVINSDGTLTYTPGTDFTGSDSFTYTADDGNGGTATETVTVTVTEPASASGPSDPLYAEQWHLAAIAGADPTASWDDYSRLETVWQDYSGAGVFVGIFDDGIEYTHRDLAANYDASAHLVWNGTELDPYPTNADEARHGTAVAGVIAAAANGEGTVGVAPGATISGVNIFSGDADINSSTPDGFKYAIGELYRYDISNHSWGAAPTYLNDTNEAILAFIDGAAKAVAQGRGGLGSIVLKAAGNWSDSAQGDAGDATRHTVSVAAYDSDGDASWYTNRGANVLVSAPSSGNTLTNDDGTLTAESDLRIATTDREGSYGYSPESWSSSGDTTGFGGTSSATPTTAGVVALMLEANPGLGWRDVQNILAYSARETGSETGVQNTESEVVPVDLDSNGTFESRESRPVEWYPGAWNGAQDWNGGGHHVSMAYGHGAVDAYNAVRMAEAWSLFGPAQTSANEVEASTGLMTPNLSVSGNGSSDTYSFTVSNADMDLEYVDISIKLNTTLMQEVMLEIESPSGTRATLLDVPLNDYTPAFSFAGMFLMTVDVTWTFGAHTFKGEDPNGVWKVHLTEKDVTFDTDNYGREADGNTLSELSLDFYGSAADADDVYHYTDEMVTLGLNDPRPAHDPVSDRVTLTDDGGTDWLNLSAMTYDLDVDLTGGVTARTGSGTEAIAAFSADAIENAVTGDGNDRLAGNDLGNELHGMRGSDLLSGGLGNDDLAGGLDSDTFFFAPGDGQDRIMDFSDGEDLVSLDGFAQDDLIFTESGTDTLLSFDGNASDTITFVDVAPSLLTSDDFLFATV